MLHNLGTVYALMGDFERAEPVLRRAMDVSAELLSPDHPGTLAASANLAHVLEKLGRVDEALPLQKAAYEGYARSLGTDHRATFMALRDLRLHVFRREPL